MEPERLNSPDTSVITIEILGNELHFAQDPNSKHLGTTVWDASMVLVKYLEKNSRKGRFCASKLKGKRAIELGAGCGVAGFGMALLGCDVITTDQAEVLPLLRRNVERNTSRILQMNSDSFGSIQVAELDWGNMEQIQAVHPPFDFIIGTDVVYAENLLEPLLQTIGALSGPRTTILLGYEIRSTNVHEQMLQMWKTNFDFKTIPKSKMHSKYQHPSIQLYMMGSKSIENSDSGIQRAESTDEATQSVRSSDEGTPRLDQNTNDDDTTEPLADLNSDYTNPMDDPLCEKSSEDCKILPEFKNGDFSEWEARRYGSMAARLLRDIKIT